MIAVLHLHMLFKMCYHCYAIFKSIAFSLMPESIYEETTLEPSACVLIKNTRLVWIHRIISWNYQQWTLIQFLLICCLASCYSKNNVTHMEFTFYQYNYWSNYVNILLDFVFFVYWVLHVEMFISSLINLFEVGFHTWICGVYHDGDWTLNLIWHD